jgi:hypothetical protein
MTTTGKQTAAAGGATATSSSSSAGAAAAMVTPSLNGIGMGFAGVAAGLVGVLAVAL